MEASVKVLDHVPVINFRNHVTVRKVPLDVVGQGLGRLLSDAGKIPSGLGARTCCLVILVEGGAEVLPTVDRVAGRASSQLRA